MKQILVGLSGKKFIYSILSSLKLNFSTTVLGTTHLYTLVFRVDTGNNSKIITRFWKLLSNSNVNPTNGVADR